MYQVKNSSNPVRSAAILLLYLLELDDGMNKSHSLTALFTHCADLINDGDGDTEIARVITMVCSAGTDQNSTLKFVQDVLHYQRLAVMSAADTITDGETIIAALAMQSIYRDLDALD